jgi:O-antigen ligase
MPLKSLLFISLFAFCVVAALFVPYIGVYGYIAEYCIGSAGQWWEAPFSGLGLRYSFMLAGATAAGMLLHWRNLNFGDQLIQPREGLLLAFLAVVWVSALLSPDTTARYSTVDHPSVKFTKIIIFVFMMTHIVTDFRKVDGLMWVFVLVALLLGLQAWSMPRRAFQYGRLENIGGADFAEANFFAAFMAAMLPIIGIQLLRAKKYWLKGVCAVSAAFTANAVVLCRSRGAFVGIAAGALTALSFAPKKMRKQIIIGLVLGIAGGIYVADPQFLERIGTISVSEEELDESAASRFRLWEAGAKMFFDHPLGIGIGNWYQTIGRYIPEYAGKDSHNTYVKALAELGILGITLFALLILGALRQLWKIRETAHAMDNGVGDDFLHLSFGLGLCLVVMLVCGLTITMTYGEFFWIMLFLPVCLQRALDNAVSKPSTGDDER